MKESLTKVSSSNKTSLLKEQTGPGMEELKIMSTSGCGTIRGSPILTILILSVMKVTTGQSLEVSVGMKTTGLNRYGATFAGMMTTGKKKSRMGITVKAVPRVLTLKIKTMITGVRMSTILSV